MKADTQWSEWKRRFERYRIATKLFQENDEIQVSTLLYTMGPESKHIFAQFSLKDKEDKKYELVKKFDEHFQSERNVIHEQAMFHQRCQQILYR